MIAFPVDAFYGIDSEHRAIVVFDSRGAFAFCNSEYENGFADLGYAELLKYASDGSMYANAMRYSVRRYRIVACKESYCLFSICSSQSISTRQRDALALLHDYIYGPVSWSICSVEQVLERWRASDFISRVRYYHRSSDEGRVANVLASPAILSCAVAIACRIVSGDARSSTVELRLTGGTDRVYLSARSRGPQDEHNVFLMDLLLELAERGGFSVECLSDGRFELRLVLRASSATAAPITARDIAMIELAAYVFSVLCR